MRMKKMKYSTNKVEKEAIGFFKSEKGKTWLIIGLVCFLLGAIWQVVLIAVALMGVGYLVYKKNKGELKFDER